MKCPLCSDQNSVLYDQEKHRSYFHCQICDLVFVPRDELITLEQERERYEAHKNHGPEYENYLKQMAHAIEPHLTMGTSGLDFGSGKSKMLETFLNVRSYDVFFHPDQELLEQKYDFILLSEVIEHLRDLSGELTKIKNLLRTDGLLFIKTKFLPEQDFKNWFYKRDRTHIQFFNERSLNFISKERRFFPFERVGEDLYLLRNK